MAAVTPISKFQVQQESKVSLLLLCQFSSKLGKDRSLCFTSPKPTVLEVYKTEERFTVTFENIENLQYPSEAIPQKEESSETVKFTLVSGAKYVFRLHSKVDIDFQAEYGNVTLFKTTNRVVVECKYCTDVLESICVPNKLNL